MEGELERKIGIALSTVGAMKEKIYFGNRGLSRKAKIQVGAMQWSMVLRYGCEYWMLREKEKSRL